MRPVPYVPSVADRFDLAAYIERHKDWSLRTIGEGIRTGGTIAHIRKELLEIEAAPRDLEEWIDVIILGLDGAWRAGHTPAEIVAALQAKQQKIFARTYPKPVSENHPAEHLRS